MPPASTSGDQRVTIAVLGQKLDSLTEIVKRNHEEDCKTHEALTERVSAIEKLVAVHENRLKNIEEIRLKEIEGAINSHGDEIDEINKRTSWWNGVNSFGVIVAGIVAFFKS